MKKIEAIFRAERLNEVRKALEDHPYPGVSISEVIGHGKKDLLEQLWYGKEYQEELLPYVRLELVVPNDHVYRIASAIMRTARTGEDGDGKIFVSTVDEVVRIRDGEEGDDAV